MAKAKEMAAKDDRRPIFVASVTGTEEDPQGLARQAEALEAAGVVVLGSNAAAARLAGLIVAS